MKRVYKIPVDRVLGQVMSGPLELPPLGLLRTKAVGEGATERIIT